MKLPDITVKEFMDAAEVIRKEINEQGATVSGSSLEAVVIQGLVDLEAVAYMAIWSYLQSRSIPEVEHGE